MLAWVTRRGAGRLVGSGAGLHDADTWLLTYVAHHCRGRPVRSPFLGWCAVCGRVRVRGLRPAGPPRPRSWVHTWVCANGCPSKGASSSTVISRPLLLVVAGALVLADRSHQGPPRPSGLPCVVGDQAGAWDARPCPQAPARQPQERGQSHPEQPGGPA